MEHGSALSRLGGELGKAVQTRWCATGGAGHVSTTKGTTAICSLRKEVRERPSFGLLAYCLLGWKRSGHTKQLREEQLPMSANWR